MVPEEVERVSPGWDVQFLLMGEETLSQACRNKEASQIGCFLWQHLSWYCLAGLIKSLKSFKVTLLIVSFIHLFSKEILMGHSL